MLVKKVAFRKYLKATSINWLRELDLNQRPLGYEPNELPDCSIPRYLYFQRLCSNKLCPANTLSNAENKKSSPMKNYILSIVTKYCCIEITHFIYFLYI